MAYKKQTTKDMMTGESKIKGGKHKGPVKLFPLAKGEGGVPGEPWDDPSKRKGPFVPAPKRLAKHKNRPEDGSSRLKVNA